MLPRLEKLEQERQAEIPGLQTEVQDLSEKEKTLHSQWQQAVNAHSAAASKLTLRSNWFDHQINLQWTKIYSLAPAVILDRQKKWRDQINEARLRVECEERRTAPNMFGASQYIFVSNVSMIRRRIDAITGAIKVAKGLEFQPLTEPAIVEKLDGMEKTFPPLTTEMETKKVPAPDVSHARVVSW